MTFPSEITAYTVVTYTVATVLAFFALWAKVDAYRVIKDFAWCMSSFHPLLELPFGLVQNSVLWPS